MRAPLQALPVSIHPCGLTITLKLQSFLPTSGSRRPFGWANALVPISSTPSAHAVIHSFLIDPLLISVCWGERIAGRAILTRSNGCAAQVFEQMRDLIERGGRKMLLGLRGRHATAF